METASLKLKFHLCIHHIHTDIIDYMAYLVVASGNKMMSKERNDWHPGAHGLLGKTGFNWAAK